MTNQSHLITPPFELMNQWFKKVCEDPYNGGKFIMAPVLKEFGTTAAQWGADQELEACCEWLRGAAPAWERQLRTARRPKPPSLKEQALSELNLTADSDGAELSRTQVELIRRALEKL